MSKNLRKYEVKTFYVVQECECGGEFDISVGNVRYLTSPVQMDYKCNKCGKIETLFEPNFPHTELEKI